MTESATSWYMREAGREAATSPRAPSRAAAMCCSLWRLSSQALHLLNRERVSGRGRGWGDRGRGGGTLTDDAHCQAEFGGGRQTPAGWHCLCGCPTDSSPPWQLPLRARPLWRIQGEAECTGGAEGGGGGGRRSSGLHRGKEVKQVLAWGERMTCFGSKTEQAGRICFVRWFKGRSKPHTPACLQGYLSLLPQPAGKAILEFGTAS